MPDASLHPFLAERDDAQRLRALDVTRSFLVQAPAGSGKTELLIQRFLALLATVERPESILAMTFTRKAAGEMRERIINALRDAAAGIPVSDAHAQRTRALAQAALRRDGALGWHLIDHPARLRLVTIDALATGLAREAPLTTRTGAMPAFSEHPDALYHAAASEALTQAAAGDTAWRTLLDQLDNDGERVVDLLAELLGKRDQWLRHLVGIDPDGLRAALEATLVEEIEARLATAHALFPANALPRLAALARHALAHLTGEPASAQLLRALHACHAAGGIPGATCDEMADWASLANWLLVKTPAWRKTVNQTQGFAPTGTDGKAGERKARKREMLALLAELAQVPGLVEAVDAVRHLPPRRYAEATWEMVAALLTVLPRVAAALKVQFAAQRTIDFSEATELALLALGTPEAPSDVLLALDQRIGHLLVDEFQDTSLMQRDLVLRLTAGWVAGDGRTLFAVGDPMQSIYRFREAEVSLFLAAQSERRVGEVAVEPLTLSRNFRSQAGIVDWVNDVFPKVLPDADNPARGAVAFKPSVASHSLRDGAPVTVDLASTDHEEATRVICRVRDALASQPRENVAILVRARTHLAAILPALRAAGVAFQAVELDRLTERAAIRDLLALTHALLQPADRLAWLAILRAPWCGLVLADLLAVATHAHSVWPAIRDVKTISGLSDDGRDRLARVVRTLTAALEERHRQPLELALRGTWLALGGPATLSEPSDVEAAERYFALAAEHAVAGDIPDWAGFLAAVDALHAAPDPAAEGRVQIMTLHKAKGLQFGTVIIAGLARTPRKAARDLLLWRVRPAGLMLAPMRSRDQERDDPLYAYLLQLHADEEAAEVGRLLYVGATRAKHRLHFTACLATRQDHDGRRVWKAAPSASLFAKLFPFVDAFPPPEPTAADGAVDTALPHLLRLPASWRLPLPPLPVAASPALAVPADTAIAFDWARETARQVGIVAHRFLARIAGTGLEGWSADRVVALRPRIRAALLGAGVGDPELNPAIDNVERVLAGTLADPRGRWLFDVAHTEAHSEWALAGIDGDALVHVTLDWSFVCEGRRWIIDFKTGAHEGTDRDAFLDRERIRYEAQLTRYARLLRGLDIRPIRLGLYYPLQGGWREWPFDG